AFAADYFARPATSSQVAPDRPPSAPRWRSVRAPPRSSASRPLQKEWLRGGPGRPPPCIRAVGYQLLPEDSLQLVLITGEFEGPVQLVVIIRVQNPGSGGTNSLQPVPRELEPLQNLLHLGDQEEVGGGCLGEDLEAA